MLRDFAELVNQSDIEVGRPEAARVLRRRVPVILFLEIHEYRFLPGCIYQITVWQLAKWRPANEMGIWFKRIVVVVKENRQPQT